MPVPIQFNIPIIPRNFLYLFSLKFGAVVVGIVTLCILVFCAVVMIFQILDISHCHQCNLAALHNCFAYSVAGFVYVITLIGLNLSLFHGIKHKKPSIVLTWIVAFSMWIGLTFVVLITFIGMYITEGHDIKMDVAAAIIGLVAIVVPLYGVLVLVGFWREIKRSRPPPTRPRRTS